MARDHGPHTSTRQRRHRAHPPAPISFLLVDKITEFEEDKRIVGVKNVSLNERYLAHRAGELPVLPPTILTEAVAQVGAILILAKPENREKLPYFLGLSDSGFYSPCVQGMSS